MGLLSGWHCPRSLPPASSSELGWDVGGPSPGTDEGADGKASFSPTRQSDSGAKRDSGISSPAPPYFHRGYHRPKALDTLQNLNSWWWGKKEKAGF